MTLILCVILGAVWGDLEIIMNDVFVGAFPIWVVVLDYILGAAMWTLVGRFGMSLFLREDSDFFFNKAFQWLTNPLLRLFAPITPSFLILRMHPLYVAWFIFMLRFYIIPLLFGYSVLGVLSFPLESEIARFIYDMGNLLTTRQ